MTKRDDVYALIALAIAILALVFLAAPSPALAQEPEFVGSWMVVEKVDEMTDEHSSLALLLNSDGSTDLMVGFWCMPDGLNFVVVHKYLTGRNDKIPVTLRLDRGKPETHQFNLFPDHELSWAPMRLAPTMLQRFRSVKDFAVRVVDPADGKRITKTYSGITGTDRAFSRLRCAR